MTEAYEFGGTTFVLVRYIEKYEVLVVRWPSTVPSTDIGKRCCSLITQMVEKHHPIFFVNDNRSQTGSWPDMGKWLVNEWIPSLAKGGIKYYAHVLSPSLEGQLSVKSLFTDNMYGISFMTFYGSSAALKWLSKMSLNVLDKESQSNVFQELSIPNAVIDALKESYENLEFATETGKMAIWTLDLNSGEYVVNDQWLSLFEISNRQHTIDNNLWKTKIHPEDVELISSAEKRIRKTENLRLEMNFRIVQDDLNVRHVRCSMAGRKNEKENKLSKITGINFDITDLLEREQALETALTAKSELIDELNERNTKIEEQNQKLKRFAFTNAHDVRAPLARILGLAETLKSHENLSLDKKNELTDNIIDSSNELDAVIRRLAKILSEDGKSKIDL